MSAQSTEPQFPRSLRVYQSLLRFYPLGVRANHGNQMEQLFRDQCRDAFEQGTVGARLRFWLGILGDTAVSLCQSWLSSEALRNLFYSNISRFPLVFCFVLGCVMLITVAMTGFQPIQFYAHVFVTAYPKVEENYRGIVDGVDSPVFPVLISRIKSDEVLERIAKELDLANKWARNAGKQSPLSTAEAIHRLRQECQVRWLPKSPGFNVTVYDSSATETANIAKRIVAVFRETANTNADRQKSILIVDAFEDGRAPSVPRWSRTLPQGFVLGSLLGLLAVLIISLCRLVFERPVVASSC